MCYAALCCVVLCFVLQVYGGYYRKLSMRVQSALSDEGWLRAEACMFGAWVSLHGWVCVLLQVYGSYYRKLSKRVQSALAEANAVAEEVLSAMSTVSMFMFMPHSSSSIIGRVHATQLACSWHRSHARTYGVAVYQLAQPRS